VSSTENKDKEGKLLFLNGVIKILYFREKVLNGKHNSYAHQKTNNLLIKSKSFKV